MNTFRAYFQKEILESKKQYRYIVLGFGFIFFALLEPLTLKLLPKMMEGQVKGNINSLFNIRGVDAFNQYIQKEIFQMCILIITLGLMNIIIGEYRDKKLIFPFSKGASITQIIMAKGLHYSIATTVFLWVGIGVNVYYTGIAFSGVDIPFKVIIKSGAFTTLYILFIIALIMCVSTFIRRGIGVASIVLIFNYFSPVFSGIKSVKYFLPYNLLNYSGTDHAAFTGGQKLLFAVVVLYIIILYITAMWKAKSVEING